MPVSRDPYLGSHIITKKPTNNEMSLSHHNRHDWNHDHMPGNEHIEQDASVWTPHSNKGPSIGVQAIGFPAIGVQAIGVLAIGVHAIGVPARGA